ncbi:VENN motif pre-toxin domain-containing protein [Escherichia coli]|uniref:VENN motif pre-toxin domain-containing protein n=1 Tax=Escherichia coli TaxID=562 RepID=UPI001E5921CD|nr:VENN motif pre-toxin domain-containing protein [Escherichia coli]
MSASQMVASNAIAGAANALTGMSGSSGHAEGTTSSAISGGNLIIRNKDSQKQDIAGLSRDPENANGSIAPIFDREKEQKRLQEAQIISQISGQMSNIVMTYGETEAMKAARKEHPGMSDAQLRETPEYREVMKGYGTGSTPQMVVQAITGVLGGLNAGNPGQGLAGGLNPAVAQLIKQATGDNREANLMAHAVWGALAAQLGGNNAASGAAGAFSGELAARYIIDNYYGGRTDNLSEQERQQISMLATIASGIAGGLAGNSTSAAGTGAQAGRNSVENNSLSEAADYLATGKKPEDRYKDAQQQLKDAVEEFKAKNCAALSADACSTKMDAHRDELLAGAIEFGSDFIPVYSDIKSFAEADSALSYLAAIVGIMPGLGDTAGKAIKGAEKALKAGDLETASKLINKASDEIQAVKALDVGSYKELKDRSVVGDGLEHDHIPSFAAIRQAKENELGRKLTPAEEKNLYNNATAVEVPKDVHQAGPTYGGKNTSSQVKQDAINLCGAECRDTDALRKNMLERGYDPKLVDDAIRQLKERNSQIGVTK